MFDAERRSNPSGKLTGSYQAKIESVDHPKGLFLAKIRLLGLLDNIPVDDLPWAEFQLPLGAKPHAGHQIPVEKGDLVWVDYPRNGDSRYPRITGSCYHAPDYKSWLPDNGAKGKSQGDEPPAPELSFKDDVYERFGIQEYKTHEGVLGIVQTATGTRLEISKAGIVVHCEGDSWRSSTGDTTELVNGTFKLVVDGPLEMDAEKIKITSKGEFAIDAGGAVKIESIGKFSCKAPNWDFHN